MKIAFEETLRVRTRVTGKMILWGGTTPKSEASSGVFEDKVRMIKSSLIQLDLIIRITWGYTQNIAALKCAHLRYSSFPLVLFSICSSSLKRVLLSLLSKSPFSDDVFFPSTSRTINSSGLNLAFSFLR